MIAQRMVDTPAAIGEKRQTARDGAIQQPFDAGTEPSETASGEDDNRFGVSDLCADGLQAVLHHAPPRRRQPAAEAPLAKRCASVCVDDGIAAGVRQDSRKLFQPVVELISSTKNMVSNNFKDNRLRSDSQPIFLCIYTGD